MGAPWSCGWSGGKGDGVGGLLLLVVVVVVMEASSLAYWLATSWTGVSAALQRLRRAVRDSDPLFLLLEDDDGDNDDDDNDDDGKDKGKDEVGWQEACIDAGVCSEASRGEDCGGEASVASTGRPKMLENGHGGKAQKQAGYWIFFGYC